MDAVEILSRQYAANPKALDFLMEHSRRVADKALVIARRVAHLGPDEAFIEEASVLHDIGIIGTHAPMLGCDGDAPYICHGVLGRKILESEGLNRHALVCERHVGVGLSIADIREKGFPLPLREMVPVSLEEQIICFADKFFSKLNTGGETKELPVDSVREVVARYGPEKLAVFDGWLDKFGH